jgi:hypothetical protein
MIHKFTDLAANFDISKIAKRLCDDELSLGTELCLAQIASPTSLMHTAINPIKSIVHLLAITVLTYAI